MLYIIILNYKTFKFYILLELEVMETKFLNK